MKAKRQQIEDKIMVIKLFASNYARDLIKPEYEIYGKYALDSYILGLDVK